MQYLDIYAFDPGKATGLCWLRFCDSQLVDWKAKELDHMGVGSFFASNPEGFRDRNRDSFETVVVCESFTITPKTPNSPWSLETIGLIRYWAGILGLKLVLQKPSEAFGLITDDRLKKCDMWTKASADHMRSATKHAIYYAVINRKFLTDVVAP